MRELRRVRTLTERADQFQLTLPKRRVKEMFTASEDDKYYARVDFEDDFIKVTPVEMVAEKSDLESSIEDLKKRLGVFDD